MMITKSLSKEDLEYAKSTIAKYFSELVDAVIIDSYRVADYNSGTGTFYIIVTHQGLHIKLIIEDYKEPLKEYVKLQAVTHYSWVTDTAAEKTAKIAKIWETNAKINSNKCSNKPQSCI